MIGQKPQASPTFFATYAQYPSKYRWRLHSMITARHKLFEGDLTICMSRTPISIKCTLVDQADNRWESAKLTHGVIAKWTVWDPAGTTISPSKRVELIIHGVTSKPTILVSRDGRTYMVNISCRHDGLSLLALIPMQKKGTPNMLASIAEETNEARTT